MSTRTPILVVMLTLIVTASLTHVARSSNSGDEILDVSTKVWARPINADTATSLFLPIVTRDYCTGFFDDFSDPASGWTIEEDDYVSAGYSNGEYLIHTKAAGYFYLYRAPSCELDNYTVEIDARWAEKTGQSYGLIFDVKESFSYYYLFDINTDYQQFRLLYRYGPGLFTEIVSPTYSPAIQPGLASNHMGVTRLGDQITLFVNGVELGSYWDYAITGAGGVGIISSPYDDRPKSDALFDNFSLAILYSTNTVAESPATTGAGNSNSQLLERFVEPASEDPGW
jgi:hypothetical protein